MNSGFENTIEQGDWFENKCLSIVENAIKSQKFSVVEGHCRIYTKKAYHSKKRNDNIIFDIAIEVTPPGADRPTLLYLVECKNYSSPIPVGDLEEFAHKVSGIGGMNTKPIFISNNRLQKGARNIVDNENMMFIQVDLNDEYEIITHHIERNKKRSRQPSFQTTWDDRIGQLLTEIFNHNTRIDGILRLSKTDIENRALNLIRQINPSILNRYERVPIRTIAKFLAKTSELRVDYGLDLGNNDKDNLILGQYNANKRLIQIDKTVCNTIRESFVLGHEIGHHILHGNLKFNKAAYDSFSDSAYNYELDKHELVNDRQWIEWQANQFASSLMLPSETIRARLVAFQMQHGIRNLGELYLDNQPVNKAIYHKTVAHLSYFFQVSKTNIEYRLDSLGLVNGTASSNKHWSSYFNMEK